MKIDPNDPKLTAYALGELDDTACAVIEAQIERSEELRLVVDEIRKTGKLLTKELQTEPIATLSPDQRKRIEAKAASLNGKAARVASRPSTFWRRYWIPTTAAASLLIIVGAGSALLASLRHSRSDYQRLAAASNIKSGGISGKIYADENAQQWMIPGANRSPVEVSPVSGDSESASTRHHDLPSPLLRPLSKPGERFVDMDAAASARSLTSAGELGELDVSLNGADGVFVVEGPPGHGITDHAEPSEIEAYYARRSLFSGTAGGQEEQSGGGAATQGRGFREFRGPASQPSYRNVAQGHAAFNRTPVGGVGARPAEDLLVSVTGLPLEGRGVRGVQGLEYLADDFGAVDGVLRRTFADGYGTEAYDHIVENPFLSVMQNPLSTFSIDVDTASYANVRRFLNSGQLPPPGAVRIEEMVNYFDHDYPLPTGDDPFSVIVDVADCPWNPKHLLARIGIKGQEFAPDERPPANLVFLIDVSGSMQPYNKLLLLKDAMRMLVEELSYDDYVAMVVYAGASGLVLDSTSCDDKGTILSALDDLQAGGSTDGGSGIQLAYDVATGSFIEGGINRVILATDGDFNVGITNRSSLTELIEEKAKTGVFLSVLGFGMGNYKDSTLETLADKGNGNYAYIDTHREARKVLVEQLTGTLMTIAKDVKIQVEFNPVEVSAYRLIGYENRLLAAQDFNDDTKDAGEIGAGHTVTAFYEIIPGSVDVDLPTVDPLKYQVSPTATLSGDGEPRGLKPAAQSGELMTVKLRYKRPDGDTSKLIEVPVRDEGLALADMPDDFVFAASVASFGMLLRSRGTIPAPASSAAEGPTRDFTFDAVLEIAEPSVGHDPFGYRAEFITLVEQAASLTVPQP